MRISDWSSDVCSSDLNPRCLVSRIKLPSSRVPDQESAAQPRCDSPKRAPMSSSRDAVSPQSRKWPRRSVGSEVMRLHSRSTRSEEHTSELQSLMRISYAVFCLKKTHNNNKKNYKTN